MLVGSGCVRSSWKLRWELLGHKDSDGAMCGIVKGITLASKLMMRVVFRVFSKLCSLLKATKSIIGSVKSHKCLSQAPKYPIASFPT